MAGVDAQSIEHVAIDVTDIDRAKAFYGDLLGLQEIERPATFTFPGAWYQVGAEVLHLVSRPERYAPAPHHFCLWVADIAAAAEVLSKNGFPAVFDTRYKIPGVDRFFVRDPDGNRVEFQGRERADDKPSAAS